MPIVIRPRSAAQRAAWLAAAADAGETMSEFVRGAVDRELERGREQAELEEKRRAAGPAGVVDKLDAILEQARQSTAG